jgi:hypothetical protein
MRVEERAPSRCRTRRPSPVPAGATRITIAVCPAGERARRQRLFDALEEAYPVHFEGREPGAMRAVSGILAIGHEGLAASSAAPGLPSLLAFGEEVIGPDRTLNMCDHAALPGPVRSACLTESHVRGPLERAPSSDNVLATIDGAPVWWIDRSLPPHRRSVAVVPADLGEDESLRNRLSPKRCLALLALTEFVIGLVGDRRLAPPPLRAAFTIDDPNLHWLSYGHMDYARVRASADVHDYHVSIAMVPIDAWFGHPRAVRLFREGRARLSVCTHGNDHDGPEMGRPQHRGDGATLAEQAIRRMVAFERRTGLTVDRVIVPPHEQMSEAAASALVSSGFEAFSHTLPYPWISDSPDLQWLTRPSGAGPLIGWTTAEVIAGGLPALVRRAFDFSREDLVFRAYLGQPLIVSGHHDLMKDGTEALEEIAAAINALGDVRWCSLGDMARSAVETRADGEIMHVKVLGRRVRVLPPRQVRELRIDAEAFASAPGAWVRICRPGHAPTELEIGAAATLEVQGGAPIEIMIVDPPQPPPSEPIVRARPLARRLVTEGRDRIRPVIRAAQR